MEIRSQSKTGRVVASLADMSAKPSRQPDSLTQQWRHRLAHAPSSFARLEVEIHDHFRHLADQMTATLLADATAPDGQAGPEKKGALAVPADHDAPRSRGG